MKKINISGPPEDLVEEVAKEFPEAWDRGWFKLEGSGRSKVFEHPCRGDVLTIALVDYTAAKGTYRVGNCMKCQGFFYFFPGV